MKAAEWGVLLHFKELPALGSREAESHHEQATGVGASCNRSPLTSTIRSGAVLGNRRLSPHTGLTAVLSTSASLHPRNLSGISFAGKPWRGVILDSTTREPSTPSCCLPAPQSVPSEAQERSASADELESVFSPRGRVPSSAASSAHASPSHGAQKPSAPPVSRIQIGVSISRIDLHFQDLTVEVPGNRVVLQKVTGGFRSGRVTAIMGPSGDDTRSSPAAEAVTPLSLRRHASQAAGKPPSYQHCRID
jgi:hypothetical protein